MDQSWTDDEVKFLREHWLAGWDDIHIAPKLNRTRKSVSAKRRSLHLTRREYPIRPEPFGARHVGAGGRRYTKEESADILRLFDEGKPVEEIAQKYGVSRRAMNCKVDRELETRENGSPQLIQPTARGCLGCGRSFFSKLPKSKNRQCQSCKDTRAATGASFLTIY